MSFFGFLFLKTSFDFIMVCWKIRFVELSGICLFRSKTSSRYRWIFRIFKFRFRVKSSRLKSQMDDYLILKIYREEKKSNIWKRQGQKSGSIQNENTQNQITFEEEIKLYGIPFLFFPFGILHSNPSTRPEKPYGHQSKSHYHAMGHPSR